MNERDASVLNVIAQYLADHAYAVSVREIGEMIDLASSATVHARLKKLRKRGLVDWVDGEKRTVHLTHAGYSALTSERVFGIMRGIE